MALNWEAISNNIINISQVLNDFLDTVNAKEVEWVYMDEDGTIHNVKVPNIGTAIKELKDTAVTPDELANNLKNYYTKTEVDDIKNAINTLIDKHVNDINNSINNLGKKVDSNTDLINTKTNELNTNIDNVRKTSIMTREEFEAIKETNRKVFAGSGMVEYGNTYEGLNPEYKYTLRDLWNHSWPGCCNFRQQTDPLKYAYYSKAAKVLHWSREGWSFEGGSINPKLNINGSLITIRGINENKAFEPCIKNVIEFPEAPTVKAIVTDSIKLTTDVEQGDFIILKDLNRELVSNGTFDNGITGWESEKNVVISWDSNNKKLKAVNIDKQHTSTYVYLYTNHIPVIKGVKYKLSLEISGDTPNTIYIKNDIFSGNTLVSKPAALGINEIEFVATTNSISIAISDTNNNEVYIDNVTIKQSEETPVIALEDVKSGVDIYDNSDKFEGRDSVSRQDLVFIEKWIEKVSEKGILYPYGNIQYQGGDVEGLNGITEGTFEGADTYSLFGNWQKSGDLIGKGYIVKNMTIDEIVKFASNPEHKVFIDNGELYQERYRIRVIKGLGNDWLNPMLQNRPNNIDPMYSFHLRPQVKGSNPSIPEDLADYSESYFVTVLDGFYLESRERLSGLVEAIPLILVQRRNDGIFHKIYNPVGTARAYDKTNQRLLNFEEYALTDGIVSSLSDCFDVSKIAAVTKDNNIVPADDDSATIRSGYIDSKISGHEAGLFTDEINQMDVEDLRMDAKRKPYKEILDEWLTKAIEGNIRGKEKTNIAKTKIVTITGKNIGGNYDYFFADDINNITKGVLLYAFNITQGFRYCKDSLGSIPGHTYNPGLGNNYFNTFKFSSTDYNKTQIGDVIVLGYLETPCTYTYNNTYIQTDIIGDPRPIEERVQIDTAKTNSGTVNKNTYIRNNSNGHYYRALSNRGNLTNIEDDISKNSNQYIDLGTNGNIGGYPQEWIEKGFSGTPLVVGEEGENLLPINLSWYDANCIKVKVSKKNINADKFIKLYVSNKNGDFVEYKYGNADLAELGNIDEVENNLVFNIKQSYSDLGYSSEQEMLDLMKVIVIYETKANNMELANNVSTPIIVSDDVFISNYYNLYYGGAIANNLVNKVGCWNIAGLTVHGFDNKTGIRVFQTNNYYIIKHRDFDKSKHFSGDFAVKWITSVVNYNNRACLQFIFKELKYDSKTKTWGDDNKFQIVNKVSTTKDTNGKTVLIGEKRIPLPYFIPED